MTGQDFNERRQAGRERLDAMERQNRHQDRSRRDFFSDAYTLADGDEAAIPWADMQAKPKLREWLKNNAPHTGRAIDIGCGLGDNAEALALAGYQTTGFDFSPEAIQWAKKRFPESMVDYQTADLLNLPETWHQSFALVHECYTLQSLPPTTLAETIPACASLVAHDGSLLVYARVRQDGVHVDGPPWPVEMSRIMSFDDHGLELVSLLEFSIERQDRNIPHVFCHWRRPK